MRRIFWPLVFVALLTTGILAFADWATSEVVTVPCGNSEYHHQPQSEKCTTLRSSIFKGRKPVLLGVVDILDILDAYNAVIAALAGVAVAVFTWILAIIARDADRNFRAVERAFVFLNDIPMVVLRDGAESPRLFLFSPTWENSGTTPTKSMTVRLNWKDYMDELPDGFPYSYGDDSEVMFLGPKARMPSNPIKIPANVMLDASADRLRIYIWGRADYEDIFGGAHYTQFCYRLNIEPNPSDPFSWIHRTYYGRYNRTDENDRA